MSHIEHQCTECGKAWTSAFRERFCQYCGGRTGSVKDYSDEYGDIRDDYHDDSRDYEGEDYLYDEDPGDEDDWGV